MELGGLEPPTSWVRSRRSPNSAIAPGGSAIVAVSPRWTPCGLGCAHGYAPAREMSDRRRIGDLLDRLSSFRTRLRLFFLLIVIVPMVAVTFIVFRLIAESENGQADARVAARQETAISRYYDARGRADRLAAGIGRDPQLARALHTRRPAAI